MVPCVLQYLFFISHCFRKIYSTSKFINTEEETKRENIRKKRLLQYTCTEAKVAGFRVGPLQNTTIANNNDFHNYQVVGLLVN